jgi:hypothetical protein
VAFTKYLCIDNRPADLLAAAIGALDGEYTVYADGYNESKFRSIRVGITARQGRGDHGAAPDEGSVAGPEWERSLHAGS